MRVFCLFILFQFFMLSFLNGISQFLFYILSFEGKKITGFRAAQAPGTKDCLLVVLSNYRKVNACPTTIETSKPI